MELAQQLGLVNNEAENDVLFAMLNDSTIALQLVQALTWEDFYEPRRAIVFAAIQRILLGVETLNRENVLAECRAVAKELFPKATIVVNQEFINGISGKIGSVPNSAILLHRLTWLRKAGDYAGWLLKELQRNPDPSALYVDAQSRWQVLSPARKDGTTLYGWETPEFTDNMIKRAVDDFQLGISRRFDWPWQSWNEMIRPMLSGVVGILTAPDGVGKSMYLQWIAEHWAKRGNKTVLFHLEDDHEYKMRRRLSRWSTVPLNAIEDGNFTPEQKRMIAESQAHMAEWVDNLHYVHAAGWSMAEIVKEGEKLRDEGECDCVLIDYVDKCAPTRRQLDIFGNAPYLREGDNMDQFKNFCEKCSIPGFTATQGNKSMMDVGRIQTRQGIDGSGKKSQRSQLVLVVTREMLEHDVFDDNGVMTFHKGDYSPVASVRIDKQNRGMTGTLYQVIRGDCFRIGDPAGGYRENPLKKNLEF